MSRQVPDGPAHLICPMHRKSMAKVCKTCPWWTQLRGTDPQSGAEVDRWDCAIGVLPSLQIETAGNIRRVQAAQESTRNEIVRGTIALGASDAIRETAEQIAAAQPLAARLIEVQE